MKRSRSQSGQAAVESAIVLPLVIFMILGTMQLFMMLQARIMAEYGAYRATRAGSIFHGNCDAMNHAAIAAVLPSFVRVDDINRLATAFQRRRQNRFRDTELTNGKNIKNEAIVWIFRENPIAGSVETPEDTNFDTDFDVNAQRLEVRLVFWFPLRIPFADWVITRMMLANYGMQTYTGYIDPLSPAHNANWPQGIGGWQNPNLGNMSAYAEANVVSKFQSLASGGKYLFPIQATHTMRMMTPAKKNNFNQQNCAPAP